MPALKSVSISKEVFTLTQALSQVAEMQRHVGRRMKHYESKEFHGKASQEGRAAVRELHEMRSRLRDLTSSLEGARKENSYAVRRT